MISDIDIKSYVFSAIKNSSLATAINGTITQRKRPLNSKKEDITISVLENVGLYEQVAVVNVNIFVADIKGKEQWEENGKRLNELCKIAKEVLEAIHTDDYFLYLESQRIIENSINNEHVINNKVRFKTIND